MDNTNTNLNAGNGADLLCDTLLANQVELCFANPGTSEMHFVAALDRKPQMRCVLGLFEGVVTGAADGYARMADRPAATLLHLGPGLANGLANLHNARRASSPMINIIGDHPDHHLPFDAPLTSDIESLAKPMSHWVHRIASADAVGESAAQAISIACTAPGQIATLILPADAAWNATSAKVALATKPKPLLCEPTRVSEAARALRQAGRTVLLLSGKALREPALSLASRIAQSTGASLMAQQSNARMERGAGRVPIVRVPYAVDQALQVFKEVARVILVGAKAPVAFFAYPGKPSSMLPEGCEVIELCSGAMDIGQALLQLAEQIKLPSKVMPQTHARTQAVVPLGPLTTQAMAQAIALHLPEHAIICDESVSSGRDFFAPSFGAAAHDFLQLTGGAIGLGLPLAAGAALACPQRKVLAMQADGSGLYTAQALWTHARERLDVVTVIFANRRYNILRHELASVGAGEPGVNARRMLELDDPVIDWVSLAKGMGVEAVQTSDSARFSDLLASAMRRRGPFLIEALI
jgi:acetolactate synthase I/II/III large subunit